MSGSPPSSRRSRDIESPSFDKAAVDRLGAFAADRFVSLGWRTELLKQATAGNHLRLTWGSGDTQVLLLGHMDTVWPTDSSRGCPFGATRGRLSRPGCGPTQGRHRRGRARGASDRRSPDPAAPASSSYGYSPRTRNRQPDLARDDRRRGQTKRRGAGARAVAARRRRQDRQERRRRVHHRGGRSVRACGHRTGERRQRDCGARRITCWPSRRSRIPRVD